MAETTTAETVTRDPMAVLETIRRRGYHKAASATVARWQSDRAAEDIPRLLAGYDALLKAHRIEPIYENAANCGHPEPGKATGAWDAWASDHTWGTGPDGDDMGDRICRLTQTGEHCAGCSEWLAREHGYSDFIHPGNCIIRPLIAAALSGEETPAS